MKLDDLLTKLGVDTKAQDKSRKDVQDRLDYLEANETESMADVKSNMEFGRNVFDTRENLKIKRYTAEVGTGLNYSVQEGIELLDNYFDDTVQQVFREYKFPEIMEIQGAFGLYPAFLGKTDTLVQQGDYSFKSEVKKTTEFAVLKPSRTEDKATIHIFKYQKKDIWA